MANRINGSIIIAILIVGLVAGLLWFGGSVVRSASAPPTVKIGLVAPFEGLYRSTGYEVLFAVKLALEERNRGQGLNGYRVELVALNDFSDPDETYRQAKAMVVDPDIVGVIGHLSMASTAAALPVYREARLATVIPWSVDASVFKADRPGVVGLAATSDRLAAELEAIVQEMGHETLEISSETDLDRVQWSGQPLVLDTDAVSAGTIILSLRQTNQTSPLFGQVMVGDRQLPQVAGTAADGLIFVSPGPGADEVSGYESFISAYQSLAGFPPGPRALLAYDAANILLDSVEKAMIIRDQQWFDSQSIRAEVSEALLSVHRQGITGEIAFDSDGRRLAAPVWVYQISEAKYPGILIAP